MGSSLAPGLRVLLVEDHEPDALLLSEFLALEGAAWAIEHVTTFAEAREAWGRGPWDALLLDLDIPDGFGLELLGRALDLVGRSGPPVVVLSGRADPQAAKAALDQGARAYVLKGVDAAPVLMQLFSDAQH